ncbi:MAG TPA: FAD-linked oxidase C-terminal domain-containing protein [Ensifer sp.]|nr:FAD-linked oxidase C-terminal domain-containing protein [Ensifer sp.]
MGQKAAGATPSSRQQSFHSGIPGSASERLTALLGSRFSVKQADREHHGRGESYHAVQAPDAVCFAQSTEEVSEIVKICAAAGVPVIPFGAGTSLEGHVSAVRGGVSLDLSRMTQIIAVRPEDLDVTVEAGVTRHQLNGYLRDTGLFFPVDPGGESTLGGMAATRASGTNAVRYGTMRENVVSLTVVLADGRVIRSGSRARKSSAGYDLTRLFVGSEGTLGIITELTVRLYGIPETVSAAICPFNTIDEAVATVVGIIQCGVPIARVELMDTRTIQASNRYSGLSYQETPTLFMEFHGSAASVAEQVAFARDMAEQNGALAFESADDADTRSRLWKARHDVHYAVQAMRPNGRVWSTDVCVPISALGPCIAETQKDVEAASFFISTVGHVGDGNFHLGLVIDPSSPAELAEANALNDRLIRRAIAFGGTSTGEHGVGTGKIKFMDLEHGAGVDVMRAIKAALDPQGILNPGKIIPDAQ